MAKGLMILFGVVGFVLEWCAFCAWWLCRDDLVALFGGIGFVLMGISAFIGKEVEENF